MMSSPGKQILVCTCGGTISRPALEFAARETGAIIVDALCGADLHSVRGSIAQNTSLLIGCTYRSAVFEDLRVRQSEPSPRSPASSDRSVARMRYVDLREMAGWSSQSDAAGPKMAALIRAGWIDDQPVLPISIESRGSTLIVGGGQASLDAAQRLAERVKVTVLLPDEEFGPDLMMPDIPTFSLLAGRPEMVRGTLGRFEVTVPDLKAHDPWLINGWSLTSPGAGGVVTCDVVLDLSSGPLLLPGWPFRDGYLRADPHRAGDVDAALFKIVTLIGSFGKQVSISLNSSACAHVRARIPGCSRCIDACPQGALASGPDFAEFDPHACAGCGGCLAVCPTEAIEHQTEARATTRERVRVLLDVYNQSGGTNPVLLLFDEFGKSIIYAMARAGNGLPSNVLPLQVKGVNSIGHELMLASLALGAEKTVILSAPVPNHAPAVLDTEFRLARTLFQGLGEDAERIIRLDTGDPFDFDARLQQVSTWDQIPLAKGVEATANFRLVGDRRDVFRQVAERLGSRLGTPAVFPLEPGSPYGAITVDLDGCTMCLSCVGACPVNALGDDPDRPLLKFKESACIQCGICAATCPENAITLEPRFDPSGEASLWKTVCTDTPQRCEDCGHQFGSARVAEKIAAFFTSQGNFSTNPRIARLCADCRVRAEFSKSCQEAETGQTPRELP